MMRLSVDEQYNREVSSFAAANQAAAREDGFTALGWSDYMQSEQNSK